MLDIIQWFFTETIYGIGALTFAVYGLSVLANKHIKKFPAPPIITALAFFLFLFTLPSYPRYKFESETLAQFEEREHFKLVNTAKWGDLIEPMTWLKTPIGFFHFVSPDPSAYHPETGGSFKSIILRYEEAPIQELVDADCENKEISIYEPDEEGVLRYTDRFGDEMTEKEIDIYCENDFTKEADLVRDMILSN